MFLYDLTGSRLFLTGLTFDIMTTFTPEPKQMLNHIINEKVQVGNDQENAQSERNSHSKTEVGTHCINNEVLIL